MIFPLAYLALTSALTVVLLAVGLAGQATLAAELAVIQGALLATFYSFSANTRTLILQGHGDLTPERLLAKRVIALPLLGIASYALCVVAGGLSPLLVLTLILRRSCEWLAEVRLCEMEVADERRRAARAFLAQAAITLAAAALLVFLPGAALPALALFAVSPLFSSPPRLKLAAFRLEALRTTLRGATPHIGSTAIEGISAYVLRLAVFLVAGAERAGLLFTAFVLGSFVATLFANVLGPSLALQRARNGAGRVGRGVLAGAWAMSAGGLLLVALALALRLPGWLGKPGYFWLALGFSLLGAGVMIAAQHIRLTLFAARQGEVLFGPDVLRNLTVIVAAPALYFLVSPAALGALYFVTALLTLFFYWSARRGGVFARHPDAEAALQVGIAAGTLLPLFFLLNGRVYHSATPLLDSAGSLMSVPLPLSLPVCFVGILLLAQYRQAALALGTIFFLFIGMVTASAVVAQGDLAAESRKFLLLFQFLIPAFALVLGQMFAAAPGGLRATAAGFAAVLTLLVPAQLIASMGFVHDQLVHDLWFFSVYQHLQYVPVIVVAAWLVALFALWESPRGRVLVLVVSPLVAYYAARSYATLGIVLAAGGIVVLAVARWRTPAAWLCASVVVAILVGFVFTHRNLPPAQQKFGQTAADIDFRLQQAPGAGRSKAMAEKFPGPMQLRVYYWTLYADGIVESPRAVLFGHARVVDREVAPSAHNYYLDFVYNFGVLAFIPLAWLIGYTLLLLWQLRTVVWRELPLLGMAIVLLFALGMDNMFKVPMRQPYAGVFFFFLWGLLLAQLEARRTAGR